MSVGLAAGVLAVIGIGWFLRVVFRPTPWDFVTISCARKRRRRAREREFTIRLLGLRAVVRESVDANGLPLRVEAVIGQFGPDELQTLATAPDALEKKPWQLNGRRYLIDTTHLCGARPAVRTIETWAESLPAGGVRFVAERAKPGVRPVP